MRQLLLGTFSTLAVLGLVLFFFVIPRFTPDYMGYGLPSSTLPNLLALSITVFSLIELWKTYQKKDDKRPSPIDLKKILHAGQILAVGFLTFPLMDIITFIPGAMVSIIAFQLICGQRKIKTILSIAVVLPIVVYLISTYLLLIPLP